MLDFMCDEKQRLLLVLDEAIAARPHPSAETDNCAAEQVERAREQLDHHVAEHKC